MTARYGRPTHAAAGPWPKRPVLYEINAWTWLHELGRRRGAATTFADVPGEEWDALAGRGFDAVWFMGVWERSPAGIRVSLGNPGLLEDFRRALPDFAEDDDVGSPYCVRRYVADPRLGGGDGLAAAREELARRGMRLVLDFVPNHVAPDHPWAAEHPEYFVRGDRGELERDPASFLAVGDHVFACGRDPYFPAWPDVLQLDAFSPGLRAAAAETVSSIADQCDGVRCDMAMLLVNDVFRRTWGDRAGAPPAGEFWPELIGAVRASHPGFLFLAEAYWDMEWELQRQGFDFCYDKKLYDRLEHASAEEVRLHLCADLAYQERLVRFLENHDEPRAAASFPPGKARAAAVVVATLPGAVLLHEGQFDGFRVRLPVFLGRRPAEPADPALRAFYDRLLGAVAGERLRDGSWHLCQGEGWPDNDSFRNLLAWLWSGEGGRHLVVVNYGDRSAQGRVRLPDEGIRGRGWRLRDLLSDENWDRDGDGMAAEGLYVDLPPWGCNLFRMEPL